MGLDRSNRLTAAFRRIPSIGTRIGDPLPNKSLELPVVVTDVFTRCKETVGLPTRNARNNETYRFAAEWRQPRHPSAYAAMSATTSWVVLTALAM